METKRTALHPSFPGSTRNPKTVLGLESIVLQHEIVEFIQDEALDLFTISSNAGLPCREALAATWLSAMGAGRVSAHGEA